MRDVNQVLSLFIDRFWLAPADALSRAAEAFIWQKYDFKRPVLDVGCGDGGIGELIYQGKVIDVGVDLDKEGVKRAAKRKIYQKTRAADATDLPFKSKSFKTVAANSTVEHIKEDMKAVEEMHRVLKPGGWLYLTVPTDRLEKVIRSLLKNQEAWQKFNQRLAHYHYRSLKDWQKLLKKTGFKEIGYEYFFPEKLAKVWYRLFKLATWKPYRRELWSYLSDPRFKRFLPEKLIQLALKRYFQSFKDDYLKEGCLLLVKARK